MYSLFFDKSNRLNRLPTATVHRINMRDPHCSQQAANSEESFWEPLEAPLPPDIQQIRNGTTYVVKHCGNCMRGR